MYVRTIRNKKFEDAIGGGRGGAPVTPLPSGYASDGHLSQNVVSNRQQCADNTAETERCTLGGKSHDGIEVGRWFTAAASEAAGVSVGCWSLLLQLVLVNAVLFTFVFLQQSERAPATQERCCSVHQVHSNITTNFLIYSYKRK